MLHGFDDELYASWHWTCEALTLWNKFGFADHLASDWPPLSRKSDLGGLALVTRPNTSRHLKVWSRKKLIRRSRFGRCGQAVTDATEADNGSFGRTWHLSGIRQG
jgi:hypothetical protein